MCARIGLCMCTGVCVSTGRGVCMSISNVFSSGAVELLGAVGLGDISSHWVKHTDRCTQGVPKKHVYTLWLLLLIPMG